MFKHNLTSVLNLQRPDKNGRFALRIRTTIRGKVSYYTTGIILAPEYWNKIKQKIVNHPQKDLLNLALTKRIAEIENDFLQQSLAGVDHPVIGSKLGNDFYKFISVKIDSNKKLRAAATTTHHLSYLTKLKEFKPALKFSEINTKLLQDFEEFCKQKGNISNTVWSASKFFKTYVNMAVREGLFKDNPIKNFEGTKYIDPQRLFLTAAEIEKIEVVALNNDNHSSFRNAANWFLFSCYSGLRYSDAAEFEPTKHADGKILLRTVKTGTDLSISIHPKLKKVIDRITDTIKSNQDYNRNLKAVANLAGINKPLTSHIARHTFSVQYLDRGGSMEVLSKLLGHSTIKTTQIYGKITNLRIDAEMQKVWGE